MRTVAILDDFKQVVPLIRRQRFQTKIIKDEKVEPGQLSQEFAVTAVAARDAHLIEQATSALITHAQSLPASRMTKGACEPAFSSAGRPCDVKVMARTNPITADERRNLCANQTTRGLVIDLFHAGLLFEMSGAKQALQSAIVAMCALAVDEQCEPFFKRELLRRRLFKLLRECIGHAGELEGA